MVRVTVMQGSGTSAVVKGNVSVIVSKCVGQGESVRVYGDRVVDTKHHTVAEGLLEGDKYREKGFSVLVRPTYNEEDEKGRFFREWRSFHGEPFRECRWDL